MVPTILVPVAASFHHWSCEEVLRVTCFVNVSTCGSIILLLIFDNCHCSCKSQYMTAPETRRGKWDSRSAGYQIRVEVVLKYINTQSTVFSAWIISVFSIFTTCREGHVQWSIPLFWTVASKGHFPESNSSQNLVCLQERLLAACCASPKSISFLSMPRMVCNHSNLKHVGSFFRNHFFASVQYLLNFTGPVCREHVSLRTISACHVNSSFFNVQSLSVRGQYCSCPERMWYLEKVFDIFATWRRESCSCPEHVWGRDLPSQSQRVWCLQIILQISDTRRREW